MNTELKVGRFVRLNKRHRTIGMITKQVSPTVFEVAFCDECGDRIILTERRNYHWRTIDDVVCKPRNPVYDTVRIL